MAVQDARQPQPFLEENQRLRRAVEELSILNGLARAIGASLNLQEILHTIIHRPLRAIHAKQGVITLVDQQANEPMKTLVRTSISSADHSPHHFKTFTAGSPQPEKASFIIIPILPTEEAPWQ